MSKCTRCGSPIRNVFGEASYDAIQPDNGLHIKIRTGYGMFTDPYDLEVHETLSRIVLCHDCSVVFLNLFPEEFKELFRGGHYSTSEEEPCCQYSWQH